MHGLLRLADEYGVSVVASRLPDDTLGRFVPSTRRIHLDLRLTPAECRSVLAHELGHVHFDHPCDGDVSPSAHAACERQADRFAARLLIDPEAYARCERVNADAESIADELGVTAWLVEVYRDACLTRLHDRAYALPRLGRNQSAFCQRVSA